MMIATRQYTRWYTCILLFCLCHNGFCTVGASDTQSNQRERTFAEDKKHRALIMRGQNSQPINRAVNEDGMTAKQIAKMRQVDTKRMQILARRKKKESSERNNIRTNRSRIKPQYDGQSNTKPPPKMGPPPPPPPPPPVEGQYGPPQMDGPPLPPPPPPPPQMTEGQYGPLPPMNSDVPPPPPMRPPPPMWEGTGYGPPPMRGSKSSKPISYGSNIKPPIKPGYPPHGPFPAPDNSYPPHFPQPDKPSSYPTYMPTKDQEEEANNLSTVRITIDGIMNTFGLKLPTSREEYDTMVLVLAQTIMDTSRAPLKINQRIVRVNVIEIEGITPQSRGSRRQLQSVDGASLGGSSFQCTFVERRQCCARDPPQGAGNPAQYCDNLGCNINYCRRLRFDIVAEQLLDQGSNRKLQSGTDSSTQRIANELYTTTTDYLNQQIDNEAFTNSLRANVRYCGALCLNTMSDVSVTGAVFSEPSDILVAMLTSAPTRFPTRNPTPRPTSRPVPTPKPRPTQEPTYYPTRYPTLFPTGVMPTMYPTTEPPTRVPTSFPTSNPMVPTLFPTPYPTVEPTRYPTVEPTRYPSPLPTVNPTLAPTLTPTRDPTLEPTLDPTLSPTVPPTLSPTLSPTNEPTTSPTISPTLSPTVSPTVSPTLSPT